MLLFFKLKDVFQNLEEHVSQRIINNLCIYCSPRGLKKLRETVHFYCALRHRTPFFEYAVSAHRFQNLCSRKWARRWMSFRKGLEPKIWTAEVRGRGQKTILIRKWALNDRVFCANCVYQIDRYLELYWEGSSMISAIGWIFSNVISSTLKGKSFIVAPFSLKLSLMARIGAASSFLAVSRSRKAIAWLELCFDENCSGAEAPKKRKFKTFF